MDTPDTIIHPASPVPLPDPVRGHIRVDHVSFAFPPWSDEEQVSDHLLHDVTFEVRPGETVALVGNTGTGKSVLTTLIPLAGQPGLTRDDGVRPPSRPVR